MPAIAHSRFRKDINGLRAWAVVLVMLFHFGVAGAGAGFIGVDVFFVISGFLMTGIIVQGLEKTGTFSVWRFYLSRAIRIMPALFVLCVVLLAIGWFYLPPVDYAQLGKHTLGALSFLSNFVFWKEVSYFAPDSHQKLLLHTWSLSVEWQFYLILPIFLLAAWKIRPNRSFLFSALALGFACSFALSALLSPTKTSTAFFLIPTRAWEMLAGGLVFMLGNSFAGRNAAVTRIYELLGWTAIVASLVFFDQNTKWPGWQAFFPVVGTALIILSARNNSVFTSGSFAQWLGTRSYSIYLWHWPIVVALIYVDRVNDPIAIATGIVLSLVLGALSYRWVENPTRKGFGQLNVKMAGMSIAVITLVICGPALFIFTKHGVFGRLPLSAEQVFMAINDRNPRADECHVEGSATVPECHYGGKKLGVIVLGDSHAAAVIRAVEKTLPNNDFYVLDWTLANCSTLIGVKRLNDPAYRCGEFVAQALEKSRSLPADAPMIIINRLSIVANGFMANETQHSEATPGYYFDHPFSERSSAFYQDLEQHMVDTTCAFAKTRPVYLLRHIPEMGMDVPRTMGRNMLLGHPRTVSISMENYSKRNAFAWAAQDAAVKKCGVTILNPLPYLCDGENCYGAKDGKPVYFDDNHLNLYGASLLVPLFSQMFTHPNGVLAVKQPLKAIDNAADSTDRPL
jgi:peptidoglycan/LPS O-acetylase OafA/YrhL